MAPIYNAWRVRADDKGARGVNSTRFGLIGGFSGWVVLATIPRMQSYLRIKQGALGQLSFTVEYNGKVVTPYDAKSPIPLRQLAKAAASMGTVELDVLRCLMGMDGPIHLILHPFPGRVFEWDTHLTGTLQWVCQQQGDDILIRQHVVAPVARADGQSDIRGSDTGGLVSFGKYFVVSLDALRVGPMTQSEGPGVGDDALGRWVASHGDCVSHDEYLANPITHSEPHVVTLACDPPVRSVWPNWGFGVHPLPGGGYQIVLALYIDDTMVPVQSTWGDEWLSIKQFPSAIGSLPWIETALQQCHASIHALPAIPTPPVVMPAQPALLAHKVAQMVSFYHRVMRVLLPHQGWVWAHVTGEGYLRLMRMMMACGGHGMEESWVVTIDELQHLASACQMASPPIPVRMANKSVVTQTLAYDVIIPDTDGMDSVPMVRLGQTMWRLDDWMAPPVWGEGDDQIGLLSADTIQMIQAILSFQHTVKRHHRRSVTGNEWANRLRIIDIMMLKRAKVNVVLSDTDRLLIDRLLSMADLPLVTVPSVFQGVLRSYQLDAVAWLSFLYESGFGACLADDMGLGKTVQVLAFFATILEKKPLCPPLMVVVPPSLIHNWVAECHRFMPTVPVVQYVGSDRSMQVCQPGTIVLATYDVVRRDIQQLAAQAFEVVVFDEAQLIKNRAAVRSLATKQLMARFRVCLTGTPIENHLDDFISILDTALPGFSYFLSGISGSESMAIQYARPFVLRRTKETILSELPPKIESEVALPLDTTQRSMYMKILEEVRESVRQSFQEQSPQRAGMLAITAILRLRQVCLSPHLIDPTYSEWSPKTRFLIDQLSQLRDEGHSVLVFSQFRSYLNLIYPELVTLGMDVIQIDGGTSLAKRKVSLQHFQHADHPVVALMTLKTGGIGLNLVKASYVYHMDPWWNPSAETQASDRAHRLGQQNKVNVIRLIMEGSIEEKIMALKAEKQALFNRVLNEGMAVSDRTLSRDDFEWLLS